MISVNNNHEPRRVRIAVADDEVELRDYWHEILPHLGYELVGIVAGGEDLVRLCRQAAPDVIITDVYLNGLSGIDAVARIRRELAVAVVFVTGRRHEDEALRSGVGAVVLAKPFTTEQLRPAIAGALGQVKEQTSVRSNSAATNGSARSVRGI